MACFLQDWYLIEDLQVIQNFTLRCVYKIQDPLDVNVKELHAMSIIQLLMCVRNAYYY